jgi:hypothetical protein
MPSCLQVEETFMIGAGHFLSEVLRMLECFVMLPWRLLVSIVCVCRRPEVVCMLEYL